MPYQSTKKDREVAYLLGIIYAVLAAALALLLFAVWPPVPWPANAEDGSLAAFIAETGCPLPSQSPAALVATESQLAPPSNAAQPDRQTTTAPPTRSATNIGGTLPAGAQSGTVPPPSTTNTQTDQQPATQNGTAGVGGSQTNKETGVTVDRSGEVVVIPMKLLGKCVRTTFDERLLLLVIIAGMLGAFVHGATSLADYIGNNRFNRTWAWFYLLRPVIGMALALVFYFVIRGGFLTTSGGAKDINPYGIAALAGLVGMFSKQATDKLGEVFGTLFRSAEGEGDAKRKNPLMPAPTASISNIDPSEIVAGSTSNSVKVTGSNFSPGAVVWLGDKPLNTRFENAETLTGDISNELAETPATYKLKIVNSQDGESPTVDFRVVSTVGTRGGTETAVTGEGGNDEFIDGCDVDFKADTADEELPITEGGVK